MAKRERVIELNQSWAGPYAALWNRPASEPFTPDPNADLYAVIPWAKDAGLELVKVQDGWKYMTHTHQYSSDWKWVEHVYRDGSRNLYINGFPTRESALKSPPPMPPGYVAANGGKAVDLKLGVNHVYVSIGGDDSADGKTPETAKATVAAAIGKLSLLDELAEVVRKASNELTHDARFFHNMALAVARRLLEKEPSANQITCGWAAMGKYAPSGDVTAAIIASRRAQLAELEGEVPT